MCLLNAMKFFQKNLSCLVYLLALSIKYILSGRKPPSINPSHNNTYEYVAAGCAFITQKGLENESEKMAKTTRGVLKLSSKASRTDHQNLQCSHLPVACRHRVAFALRPVAPMKPLLSVFVPPDLAISAHLFSVVALDFV